MKAAALKAPRIIRGLYAIIDTAYVPVDSVEKTALLLIKSGVTLLQLRSKGLGSAEMLAACRVIKSLSIKHNLTFIVNDRVDIAMLCGAAGVHLGQDDIPLKDARSLLKKGTVIGVSTHNIKEAREAQSLGADYISFGPIFPTMTKKDAHSPQGLKRLGEVRKKITLPLVAIGGITEENMADVLDAGASAVAMISDILLAPDIATKTASVISKIKAGKKLGGPKGPPSMQ